MTLKWIVMHFPRLLWNLFQWLSLFCWFFFWVLCAVALFIFWIALALNIINSAIELKKGFPLGINVLRKEFLYSLLDAWDRFLWIHAWSLRACCVLMLLRCQLESFIIPAALWQRLCAFIALFFYIVCLVRECLHLLIQQIRVLVSV